VKGAAQLIGMLDSPYVRRTAIPYGLLGPPFEPVAAEALPALRSFRLAEGRRCNDRIRSVRIEPDGGRGRH
jgi:hypothetical protein